jgi:beta-glucosidase
MTRNDFPAAFRWGAATAAYQIEGAAAEGGRGPCIWDTFAALPGKTVRQESGAVACDHYHRYQEDLNLLKDLGVDAYRFSIAWSRVFPEGNGASNPVGIAFYDRLVDGLLERGIEPRATLYHWDLPQALQDRGGWTTRESVAWFEDYAEAMFGALGDRVKTWYTFNEPWVVAWAGHGVGRHAPGIAHNKTAVQVAHHILLAHAGAVDVYRGSRRGDGKIGAVLNLYPMVPATDSPADAKAAQLLDGHHNRWWLDPILKGTYPKDVLKHYASLGIAPDVEPGDLEKLAAAKSDFLGVNYYFRKVVSAGGGSDLLPLTEVKPEGTYTAMNWESKPRALVDLLVRIRQDYGNIPLSITENGAAFVDDTIVDGVVDDEDRRTFLEGHFTAAKEALDRGVNLESYFVWSLLDNYEWAHGYDKRFGLFRVDYATQKRSWKKSSLWYRDFLRRE